VRRGQVLARLDAADVEGGIHQGQAALEATKASLRDAQTDLDRFLYLFERRSVSENELRKIRLKHDAALETMNQAQAALKTALAQREYAEIRSPMDGVVVTRAKRAGDLAVPGAPILTLESGLDLFFETYVVEAQVAGITCGKPVEVRIDGRTHSLKGTVNRVVPSGDPVTRSYQVKIALPQTPGLMPGMFGRANFPIGKNKLPVIPRRAVVERGGLSGVFVVDEDAKAHFRWLRSGREWPDRIEVTAGLQPGERFVATAAPALREGDLITGAEIFND
jgi:membrane fusion protein, multidrug efflux system